MSIRAELYGKRFWAGGHPNSEQLSHAIDLLEEDLGDGGSAFRRAHWETLKEDLITKGVKKHERVEVSKRQQSRHILPDGSKNPYRDENSAKFKNEMALWGGSLSNKRANLGWQIGRGLRGTPKTPLARKQELRRLMAGEDTAVKLYRRFMGLYTAAKEEGKLPLR